MYHWMSDGMMRCVSLTSNLSIYLKSSSSVVSTVPLPAGRCYLQTVPMKLLSSVRIACEEWNPLCGNVQCLGLFFFQRFLFRTCISSCQRGLRKILFVRCCSIERWACASVMLLSMHHLVHTTANMGFDYVNRRLLCVVGFSCDILP